jgi:predicted adenine nucleotide alpha hydrolase (AANH) superfamily ATPase
MCIESLRAEGIESFLYWYNPNIHPYGEYKSRRDTLVSHAEKEGLPLIMEDTYGLKDFLRTLLLSKEPDPFEFRLRCASCYRLRLEKAAAAAKENGLDAFTSSLFISPYQDHELLKKTAESAAEKFGIDFLYRDFRPFFRKGQKKAREAGFYMQKYCGCIFSEAEAQERRAKRLG